jgi:CRISPR-associated exonuclease Cas4
MLPPYLEDEDDPVLISALEHFSYCPRQCALIHREQTFDENIYTLRGREIHQRVDLPREGRDGDVRVETGLDLWSSRLGLVGKADLVEFHSETPYPVEYKHGPIRRGNHADLQLCAQALCLEEMLGVRVPKGAIYHFSSRQRREVEFTPELRHQVEVDVAAVREMLQAATLPPPVADARCKNCSLIESCLPFVLTSGRRLAYLQRSLFNPIPVAEAEDGS